MPKPFRAQAGASGSRSLFSWRSPAPLRRRHRQDRDGFTTTIPSTISALLAVINAATIVVLLYAYSRIRARDREGHRRTMTLAIGLGVAFLTVYLIYHASAGLAKFGGYGPIRSIYFALLAVHVLMAFVVAVLVPLTFYNAMKSAFRHP